MTHSIGKPHTNVVDREDFTMTTTSRAVCGNRISMKRLNDCGFRASSPHSFGACALVDLALIAGGIVAISIVQWFVGAMS